MRVRALDANGDWVFGAGTSNYKTGLAALEQDIKCACLEVLGDCFWAVRSGIDWLNLLGGREPAAGAAIDFQLRAAILNRQNVVGIVAAGYTVDANGVDRPIYEVLTSFSAVTPLLSSVTISTNALLDELGDILTTEDGTAIGP